MVKEDWIRGEEKTLFLEDFVLEWWARSSVFTMEMESCTNIIIYKKIIEIQSTQL